MLINIYWIEQFNAMQAGIILVQGLAGFILVLIYVAIINLMDISNVVYVLICNYVYLYRYMCIGLNRAIWQAGSILVRGVAGFINKVPPSLTPAAATRHLNKF